MTLHTVLFNIFAGLAITAGIGVIISQNPIHSVIALILTFCNATGILLLFKIELLAMMFIIIYVGAIAVLFLFVVMMLNLKVNDTTNKENITRTFGFLPLSRKTPILLYSAIFIAIVFTLFFIKNEQTWAGIDMHSATASHNLWESQETLKKPWIMLIDSISNIQTLGNLIYTYYFYYFIMAGLILLVAMIGAIVLTMYKRRQAAKKQSIYQQIARTFEKAVGYNV